MSASNEVLQPNVVDPENHPEVVEKEDSDAQPSVTEMTEPVRFHLT